MIFSFTTSQLEICDYHSDCTCSYCGENNKVYSSCDFIHLFCEEGGNTFTSKYSDYKNYYLNSFEKEKDIEIFCGEQKSAEIKDNVETTIIKIGQSYTQSSKLHCYYTLIHHNDKEVITDLFTDDELKHGPFTINTTDYDKVELMLDFKENDYSHIDETFTVKVKLNLKQGQV